MHFEAKAKIMAAPLIRSRLWRFINLFTYLLTYGLEASTSILCTTIDTTEVTEQ